MPKAESSAKHAGANAQNSYPETMKPRIALLDGIIIISITLILLEIKSIPIIMMMV